MEEMNPTAQALTVVGLIFEFMSVFLTAWQAFYPKGKVKEKMIEDRGRTLLQRAGEARARAIFTLMFLGLGMLFQGVAIFV